MKENDPRRLHFVRAFSRLKLAAAYFLRGQLHLQAICTSVGGFFLLYKRLYFRDLN